MDEQTKERLVGELREYLDALPEGSREEFDAGREVDLYALFTELAGLRNEVRLESRQFKRALDEFRGVFATLEASGKRAEEEREACRAQQASATASAERALLLELIALRDRLEPAHRFAAHHRPGRLARLGARRERALIDDLSEGLGITLRRLDQILAAYDVTPVKTIDHPIDPHVMRVAAVRADPDRPDGMVLEEARRGYQRAGEVLRLAEVVANKTEQDS